MAIVTTYVCDVSGVQGEAKDFVKVTIAADKITGGWQNRKSVDKIVHMDVARKLNLINPDTKQDVVPEPTLESKLLVLLKEYIQDIAYEAGAEAGAEQASHRG